MTATNYDQKTMRQNNDYKRAYPSIGIGVVFAQKMSICLKTFTHSRYLSPFVFVVSQ